MLQGDSSINNKRLFYFILFIAGGCFLFFCYLIFFNEIILENDLGNYIIACRYFHWNCLHEGYSPLWCSNQHCGFDLLGEGQFGIFHPFIWLVYRFLPFTLALNLEIYARYPMLALGIYLLTRRWGLSPAAALYSSCVCVFSGYFTRHFSQTQYVYTLVHIPYLLWCYEIVSSSSVFSKRGKLACLGIVFLTVSQILIGFPQGCFYTGLLEILYWLISWKRGVGYRLILFFMFLKILGVVIGTIQLIPSFDHYLLSERTKFNEDWVNFGSYHLRSLPSLFFPLWDDGYFEYTLYPGVGVIILSYGLILNYTRTDPNSRSLINLLIISLIVSIVLAFGKAGFIYRLQLMLPIIQNFRVPARYLFATSFCFAILSGIAFEMILQNKMRIPFSRILIWLRYGFLILGLIFFFCLEFRSPLVGSKEHRILTGLSLGSVELSIALFIFTYTLKVKEWAIYAWVIFTFADLTGYVIFHHYKNSIYTLDELKSLETPLLIQHQRIFIFNNGDYQDSLPAIKNIPLSSSYLSMKPRRKLDYSNEKVLALSGTLWLGKPTTPQVDDIYFGRHEWEWTKSPITPLGYARLLTKAIVAENPMTVLKDIDIESVAIVKKPIEIRGETPGQVTIQTEESGLIVLTTETRSVQLLVVAESNNPGWRVTIDGEQQEVIPVYGDYLGCLVPEGNHRIEFRFYPRKLPLACWVSLTGIVLTILVFVGLMQVKEPK